MFRHGPSCLEGPVARTFGRWLEKERLAADGEQGSQRCRPEEPCPGAPEIRTELVDRIRRAIAQGHYETPEQWDAALETLWQRLRDA